MPSGLFTDTKSAFLAPGVGFLGCFVANKFHCGDQSQLTNIADVGMLSQRF
jgi:hypothetical protein